MKFRLFILTGLLSLTFSIQAAECPQHFAGGQTPVIVNQKLAPSTRELCNQGFALLHSGITKTALWSAEHLTRDRINSARGLSRTNSFHPDDNLPHGDRAKLGDYARSGYDRGHMAPSGDMPSASAQEESFSLANMIPQNPDNNRNLWEGIESAVRTYATDKGELYVLTGPIFDGASLQRIGGRVLVPTHVFKAIYDPYKHVAGAYIANNAPGMEYQAVTIAELEKRIGINLFPGMDQRTKDGGMKLPAPTPHGFGKRNGGNYGGHASSSNTAHLIKAIGYAFR
jgi:endonuclease G